MKKLLFLIIFGYAAWFAYHNQKALGITDTVQNVKTDVKAGTDKAFSTDIQKKDMAAEGEGQAARMMGVAAAASGSVADSSAPPPESSPAKASRR